MLLSLSFVCLLISGCVAGGSGSSLEAKNAANGIDIKLEYFAFGGANLKNLKTCEVFYSSESNRRSTKISAAEVFRKRDRIQWVAHISSDSLSDKIFMESTFYTKELIGRDTHVDWTIKLSGLSYSYGSNGIE